jgi:hypothetical protein
MEVHDTDEFDRQIKASMARIQHREWEQSNPHRNDPNYNAYGDTRIHWWWIKFCACGLLCCFLVFQICNAFGNEEMIGVAIAMMSVFAFALVLCCCCYGGIEW